MKTILSLVLALALNLAAFAQHQIIPTPVSYETTDGMFMLDNQVSINLRTDDADVKTYLTNFQDFLSQSGNKIEFKSVPEPSRTNRVISISLKAAPDLASEGYELEVTENEISLSANKAPGIFNGLQTLRQLLPREFENKDAYGMGMGMIMGCKIKDYPRFGWRGLMLDVSRHFFSVEDVKAYIDKMAQYKMNVFHWHLTDDEGWRIEIKSLPKLTEVGAWRVPRHGRFGIDRPFPKEGEKATEGGFYTHEDIREVIKYATERNITIVPEVDIPGHSMAVLAAYPELSTLKEPKVVNPGGYFADWTGPHFKMLIENTLNPADEKVYEFVDKVMTEVAELFPSQYIHMGGDECYHGYWEESPEVQKFMKANKIPDTHGLQSYFVGRVQKIINSKGKKMIGWDEILEGGLAEGAAVMSWQGMKGGIEAAKLGHNVVMTPTTFAYLDYTQGDPSLENAIYASLSLKKAYSFEPVPDDVDAKYILGGQGNLWTEVIPNLQYAFYMTYPRAFAISETLWSPKESKNYQSFLQRTESHFARFDAAKTNISHAVLDPIVTVKKDGDKLLVTLENDIANTEIFYTIDNTYPVQFGNKYEGTFEVPEGDLSLRTQTFRNGRAIGRDILISRADLVKRAK
ncbi:beta-N-acetylhexosaminidase [Arcticibacterium luteifluviistationis]|uniref:beta-N-acetylhexosaminidase n=1 Tax=Arcticibacterium luteifluviistationis TaxID=1784714 RepID=A0A2Z4GDP6_9BACT|nr:family 20 glycosylhydrolase [Arcticibacterium luteifluviistationis]AWV99250.1 beta-N-acetylhexosaminidase [Arcticibacterium luteifluviistationis]